MNSPFGDAEIINSPLTSIVLILTGIGIRDLTTLSHYLLTIITIIIFADLLIHFPKTNSLFLFTFLIIL